MVQDAPLHNVVVCFSIINSTPSDPEWKLAWELALKDEECSTGQWVCIDHFQPDDYRLVRNQTKILLKKNAVPTMFNKLIDVDEIDTECDQETNNNQKDDSGFQSLKLENDKLQKKISEMESLLESNKIIMKSRINSLNELKMKQTKVIQDLRKQLDISAKKIAQLESSVARIEKKYQLFGADKVSMVLF